MTVNNCSDGHKNWYLLQLKPNGFSKAQINLKRQKFETFMPLCRVTTRSNQTFKDGIKPVFPGYLFVSFNLENSDWRKINSTFGVSRLIGFERDKPALVPEKLISGLRLRCDENGILIPPTDLEIGEKVKITAGSFAGFVGDIERLINEDRVNILFNIMGQETSLVMHRKDIERL